MPTLLLHVTGMSGSDDEKRVENVLTGEPGVFGAVANHQDECTEVDFSDGQVTVEHLVEVLENEGFGAELRG